VITQHALRIGLIAALSVVALPAMAAKGDAAAGEQKSKICQACHGKDGNGVPNMDMYPRIAGQYADYLVKSLKDYKSGARKNPIMAGFAGTLSEQDMHDLAAYFASQESPLHDLSQHHD